TGAVKQKPFLVESGRRAVYGIFILLTAASGILVYSLLTSDFRLAYVAARSNRAMPAVYKFAAWWGGQEGSLLLWSWLLSAYSAVVVWTNRKKHREMMPYVVAVLMFTQVFFCTLNAFVEPPFQVLAVGKGVTAVADGNGLNPLLQYWLMAIHPPALYLGYVGFIVPFAFAFASLVTKQPGDAWIQTTRRWSLITWGFQSMGVMLGQGWAYAVLGWGGYWGWDPVESASFMPWLTGTAYLHSVMIQQRRSALKVWNMVLIIVTFALSIFGTMLTRSGILSSVHTFGQSNIGPMFVGFLGLIVIFSVALLVERLDRLQSENELDSLVSRESSFLFNNLLLVGAAFATFWGTVFPLVSEAVRGVKITVGPPFFNQVNAPIFLAIIVLMGICPLIGWRRASTENLIRNFLYPFIATMVFALVLFVGGIRESYAVVAFSLCAFVVATILLEFYRGTRARHRTLSEGYLAAFFNLIWQNKPRYGGYFVHLGIILIAVGVAASSLYKVENQVTLRPGESATVKDYNLTYKGLNQYPTASKQVVAANLEVSQNGKYLGNMAPAKEFHRGHEQPNTEVDVRTTLIEDLYLILTGWEDDGTANFRLIVNPMVVWIWIGGVVLLFGTVIAFLPDRRERVGGG
ncbi:MAG: heme lyase CcmF/NrfE family subunit, partial [Chloroflexi bacterium]|nr:heme lyase CcmF/NrfE family subunit [Chloroflexota bacterium]